MNLTGMKIGEGARVFISTKNGAQINVENSVVSNTSNVNISAEGPNSHIDVSGSKIEGTVNISIGVKCQIVSKNTSTS